MNVEKTKAMVFNFVDPCQEFVFKGDAIERVFALNRCYAELRIMDVKLCCDLFNTLVRSTTIYACEVWVDSTKIEAIEILYRGFLKSLFEVQKTTNTSIVLAEFGKFPFEHFTWGQALLYYNCVSTITKNRILGKAWKT
jgi:hypothetical protein